MKKISNNIQILLIVIIGNILIISLILSAFIPPVINKIEENKSNCINNYQQQLDSLSLEIFKCQQNINAAKIDIKMNTPITPETDEYQLELTKKLKLDEELRLIELNNKKDSIQNILLTQTSYLH